MSFPAPPSGPPPSGGPGAATSWDRTRGTPGEAYHWLGSLTLTKVRAVDTRGGLDLVDHRVSAGYGPPKPRSSSPCGSHIV